MPSLLDKLRAEPPRAAKTVVVGGADPDIEVMGYATVSAEACGDSPVIIKALTLSCLSLRHLRSSGLEQSTKVVEELVRGGPSPVYGCTHVVIESQQFYPDPDMPRSKMVSVAESLLRIAQVTGALQALAHCSCDNVHVCLPSQWKKQRRKEVDHKESLARCKGAEITCVDVVKRVGRVEPTPNFGLDQPGKWEHALDALGMALYGLDLLHTHRWPS